MSKRHERRFRNHLYERRPPCRLLHLGVALAIFGLVLQVGTAFGAPFGYVPNNGSGTASVIDLANNSVVQNIRVGGAPIRLAATPDGKKVYVVNTGSDNISVIDTTTRRVIKTIAVGDEPSEILISPDGMQVYVPNAVDRTVSVIDAMTDTVIATLNAGSNCRHLIWVNNAQGSWVYVGNQGASSLTVIDPVRVVVDRNIGVGGGPRRLWASPDGSRVYSADYQSDTVSVVDTLAKKRIATIPVGDGPRGIVVTPNGSEIYVANLNGNSVSVISAATLTVTDTINVGGAPWTVVTSPDGARAYCVNSGSANVSVIDTVTKRVIATIPVGQGAFWAVFNADATRLYVSNPPADTISVIDTGNNRNLANIRTQHDPWVIAIQPDAAHQPNIVSVSPNEVDAGSTVEMTVFGSGFLLGAKAYSFPLSAGIAVTDVEVVNPNTLVLTLTLANNASEGPANVTVTNPQTIPSSEDGLFAVRPRPFVPPPEISSVQPPAVSRNTTATLTITGNNFQVGAVVAVIPAGRGVTVQDAQFINSSTLTLTISVSRFAATGFRSVRVTNPDGQFIVRQNAFRVQ